MGEVGLVEHLAHQVALLDPDPVLAGQHAADRDAEPQDVGAERLGPLDLAGLVGVVEDERVQIAVAGMEHIGDAQPVLRRQVADPRQHLGQAAARDRAVHAVIIGRNPPDRRKRRLAAGPEGDPLGFVAADPDRLRAVGAGDRLDLRRSGDRPRPAGPSSSTISSASTSSG